MVIEMETMVEEPEISLEEIEPFAAVYSDHQIRRRFSEMPDLKKKEFYPAEVATTRYFMQQLQQSLLKAEVPSNDETDFRTEVENGSTNNKYSTKRTRRRAAAVHIIYSEDEKESDDSEYSPEILSSSGKDSDSWTDEWSPKGPPKKRKKLQKKRKNSSEGNSSSKLPKATIESTESQQPDSNCLFVCEICSTTLENKKDFLAHTIKKHMSDKPFACNSCDKAFANTSSLHKHVRIHTQEKPYFCTICDKRFADGSNMKKHMEIHGIPHVCNGCDKELQQSLGLKSQETMDNHSAACKNDNIVSSNKNNEESQIDNEKQSYKCMKCGSNFTVKAAFEKHLKLHEICKNYRCGICDKCFCSLNDLIRHEASLHGIVRQMNKENESKIDNNKQIISTAVVNEKQSQNCSSPVEFNQNISDVGQNLIKLDENKCETTSSQLQESGILCVPVKLQYNVEQSNEVEKPSSISDIKTDATSENERLCVFQQSENTGLDNRNLNQTRSMSDYEIALIEKGNACEEKEMIQWEQKNGSILDKHDSDGLVLGLIQNVLTTNLPTQSIDPMEENNFCSTYKMVEENEEDMNSLGIFFEN